MEEPFDGNVNPLLLNRLYKDRVFYVVRAPQGDRQGFYLDHGQVNIDEYGFIDITDYTKIEDGTFIKYRRGCRWEDIFEDYKQAKERVKYLNNLYYEIFDTKPFIRVPLLCTLKDTLLEVQNALHVLYGEGASVRFSDVSAGGVQVYCNGNRETLNYSGDNKIQVLTGFIKHMKRLQGEHDESVL